MSEGHPHSRRSVALAALAVAIAALGAVPSAAATAAQPAVAPLPAAAPLPANCVAGLHDVRTGEGEKRFASHYVIDGTFGYGEFVTGSFGGQSLWRKRGANWCRIETGSAVLDRVGILAAGVPANEADRLLAKMRDGHELAPPVATAGLGAGGPHR
jgi:hypothetical protein